MTINHDLVVLWDNGADKFCLNAVPEDAQYSYIQLGGSFRSHSLQFEFEADQTLLNPLRQSLRI